MPDQATHRALMDEARAESAASPSVTWKLIVLFYEAMHTVEEAVLAPAKAHPMSHTDREIALGALAVPLASRWIYDVRGELMDMKSISFSARYTEPPSIWTDENLTQQEAALERIQAAIAQNCTRP